MKFNFLCTICSTLTLIIFSSALQASEKGFISTPHGAAEVNYQIIDGVPLFEGDIEIDPKAQASEISIYGVGRWIWWRRWPNRTVHYTIDPQIKDQAKIHWAINHINEKTQIKMIERTNERDFVHFKYNGKNGGCNSFIGRKWGKQLIRVPEWCKQGGVVHEILHALGMQHEQTRWDRNKYLKVHWDNIEGSAKHNFYRAPFISWSYTEFDFDSIMLYGPYAFSKNKKLTITKRDGSKYKENRKEMSYMDRLTIAKMYNYTLKE